jgi:hypothetical protein
MVGHLPVRAGLFLIHGMASQDTSSDGPTTRLWAEQSKAKAISLDPPSPRLHNANLAHLFEDLARAERSLFGKVLLSIPRCGPPLVIHRGDHEPGDERLPPDILVLTVTEAPIWRCMMKGGLCLVPS